ncbi:MAG: GTPase Era [Deltaproteobacteria bacterium]|nr:GTPase Era [Deltaproteobacteria bacterium]
MTQPPDFKCGAVALIGFPNVGKSTLLNRLVGEKLAITSPKPQTTRQSLLGILHLPQAQLLFLDTPGVLEPAGPLNAALVRGAMSALAEADVVVWLVDPRAGQPEDRVLYPELRRLSRPLIIALNKIDLVDKRALLPLMARFHELFPRTPLVPVSALTGEGLAALLEEIVRLLPQGPPLYPEDQVTDRTERFLAAELIRQRLLHHLGEEVPHAVAVAVEEFDERERPRLVRLRAVVFVEKESQKGIVIGKQGRLLKAVGQEARTEIEALLGCRVFLDLWVKVWKNWRRDPRALRQLGLS